MNRPSAAAWVILGLLVLGWVSFIVLAHAYQVQADHLHRVCQLTHAALDRLQDSLFTLASGCR